MARFLPFRRPPMTTKNLSCLVLAVVLGTAVTVRWYLDAEEAVHGAPAGGIRPVVVYRHLPLPMRAEPARSAWGRGEVPAASEGSYFELSAPAPAALPLVHGPCPGSAAPAAADPSAFGARETVY